MIDTQNQTILLYSYGGPWAQGLSLMSARSFRYDRELVDFNSGKPSPQDVRQLLEGSLKVLDSPDGSDKDKTNNATESGSTPQP